MRPIISLLLGSGFSVPAGVMNVTQLNDKLNAINQNEIHIHSSEAAWFLEGQQDVNSWSRWDERLFLQEFLRFYNSEILKNGEAFNYETFYDFYSAYSIDSAIKAHIDQFYDDFNSTHDLGMWKGRDCLNRVEDFNRTFSQLLASLLQKEEYWEDVSSAGYPLYDSFLNFLHEAVKTFDIKVHSLNHDLLFDWLGRSVFTHFSDGFQLAGSPYYGELNRSFPIPNNQTITKTFKVKLEVFADKFDEAICLYKLHGSISHKIIYTQRQEWPVIRIKTNYGVSGYYLEVWDEKKKSFEFEQLFDRVSPDFLSGTSTKMRHYTNDEYYANLFKHFQTNLESSQLLIVIGYGFKDPGINHYIEEYYLSKGHQIVIIDPIKPHWELLNKYNAVFIEKGVSNVSYSEYVSLLEQLQ